jgi:steroid delta-isomerase-like uncharacterized protein
MTDSNQAIARRYYYEIMNGANYSVIDKLMTRDFVFHAPPIRPLELEGFQQLISCFHKAFPDVYYNLETLIGEENKVAVKWTAYATHLGPIQTVKGKCDPTGKKVAITGVTWFHLHNNKIQRIYVNEDVIGLLFQLGVLPTPVEEQPTQSSPESNKAMVNRYFAEIMSEGNLAVIDELMSDEFIIRISSLHEPFRGKEGMKQFVTGLRTAFPDIKFTIENAIAEGNKIACQFTSISTHKAEFAGIPATGKIVKDEGTDIFTFTNGKIAEILVHENALGLMEQLGAI